MAHIKTVRFGNADTAARKGFVHAFHGMVTSLLAQKRSGDHIEIVMDDGSTQVYTISAHQKMHGDAGLEFHLAPGKEP